MNINRRYGLLQALYWMIVCTSSGYISYYLTSIGYSAGEVGSLIAAFGVGSAVIQPVLGRIADKSRRFGWKHLLLILAAGCELAFLLLTFCSWKAAAGLLFGFAVLLINCMAPLVNSANYYYVKRGSYIDFGVARGMGSLSYGLISIVMGQITVRTGPQSVIFVSMAVVAVLLLAISRMPLVHGGEDRTDASFQEAGDRAETSGKKHGFFRKYPAFSMMLLGSICMLTFHQLTSTYMIQMLRRVGGDSGNLGTTMAIAAVLELPVMFGFTRIAKKIPSAWLLVISAVSFTGKGILYYMSGSIGMIYFAQILQITSYAIYAPAVVRFSDECMAEEDKVTGQAYMSMTSAVASVIGNLSGGWIIDHLGIGSMLLMGIGFAAAGTAACCASALMVKKQNNQ